MDNAVETKNDISENIQTLTAYSRGTSQERKFFSTSIKNGKLFVVAIAGHQYLFAPSKFAGYKHNNIIDHQKRLRDRDGRDTNRWIQSVLGSALDKGVADYDAVDTAYLSFCNLHGIAPSRHHRPRRYWMVSQQVREECYPDDLNDSTNLFEGAKQRVLVNRYERDPEARRRCIEHYKCRCNVCKFDFEKNYGALGKGFIHVHHLTPLSVINSEYKVDPIQDLRPVCPNCHAMLHRGQEVLSIEDLKKLLMREKK